MSLPLVTLITPTGGRKEAYALCQKFMQRQTIPNKLQWIVVKDTDEDISITDEILKDKRFNVEIFQGNKKWRQGVNTQRPNLDEGIKYVKGEYVFVIEDDDWYSPKYLETQLFFLSKFDIVGQANSHYYNLKERKFKEWNNYKHTSLNETGMRVSQLDSLDRAVNSGQLFFDIALWDITRAEKKNFLIYDYLKLVVGMKGLPGKFGIGSGHVPDPSFTRDPFFETLKGWVGPEDCSLYLKLLTRM